MIRLQITLKIADGPLALERAPLGPIIRESKVDVAAADAQPLSLLNTGRPLDVRALLIALNSGRGDF